MRREQWGPPGLLVFHHQKLIMKSEQERMEEDSEAQVSGFLLLPFNFLCPLSQKPQQQMGAAAVAPPAWACAFQSTAW